MGQTRNRIFLACCVVAVALLVTGERPPSDPRFASPALTVRSFWRAVLEESPGAALECFVGVEAGPDADRLVHLPELEALELRALQVKPQGTGRALVQYQVHYRTRGSRKPGAFAAADEVILVRGQWRILRPVDPPEDAPRPQLPPRPRVHVTPGPEFA